MNVYWLGGVWKPYIEQGVDGEWDVTKQTGGVKERAATQLIPGNRRRTLNSSSENRMTRRVKRLDDWFVDYLTPRSF
jgi:hypothetical protein